MTLEHCENAILWVIKKYEVFVYDITLHSCSFSSLGSLLRIENKNKNFCLEKKQLLEFVKLCVFPVIFGKWRWVLT